MHKQRECTNLHFWRNLPGARLLKVAEYMYSQPILKVECNTLQVVDILIYKGREELEVNNSCSSPSGALCVDLVHGTESQLC